MGWTAANANVNANINLEITLGLGSNLGNRLLNLRSTLARLREIPEKLKVTRVSDVFETPPWGVTDQPCFLNACAAAECAAELAAKPEYLLELLKGIENQMGRQETRRWGERIIDIDILTMGSLVYDSPVLRVPHTDMHRRGFVLTPLAQILPDWVHPATGRSVADMERETRDDKIIRICGL